MNTKVWATFVASDTDADAYNDDQGSWDALLNPGLLAVSKNQPEPEDLDFVAHKWIGARNAEFEPDEEPLSLSEKHRFPNQTEYVLSDQSILVVWTQQHVLYDNLLFANMDAI